MSAPKKPPPKVRTASGTSDSWPSKHKGELLYSAALVVLIAMVFGGVASHDFIDLDDGDFVSGNEVVQAGITWPGIRYAFESFDQGSWHPLTWISHMAVCHFAGLDPGPHHIVNVALHAGSTVLLLFLLTQLTGALKPSALTAAVFALHPMHVEVVAWIAQRKEALAALFAIATILLWLRWVRGSSARWYWLALGAFLLALMSKPTVVTLPFLLLLLDYWPLARTAEKPWPRLVLEKTPFLLMSAAVSATTYAGQKWLGAMQTLGDVPFLTRLASVPVNYAFYLQKTFWPVDLSPHYPFFGDIAPLAVVASVGVLAAVTAFALWQSRRHPGILVGWLWFLGTMVPMSGLVYVGGSIHSDRFTYMAHTGLCLMLFWGLPSLLHKYATPARLQGAAIVLVVLMTARSWQQTTYWKDSYTLFTHAIASTENNDLANWLAARALIRQQRYDDAIRHAQEAVRITPRSDWALLTLADAQLRKGDAAAALATSERAVKFHPGAAEAQFSLGLSLARLGRRTEAIPVFQRTAELAANPVHRAKAYFEIGRCLVEERREKESLPYFEKAVESDPADYLARKNLAFALIEGKRLAEAAAQFKLLASLDSMDDDVRRAMQYLSSMGFR